MKRKSLFNALVLSAAFFLAAFLIGPPAAVSQENSEKPKPEELGVQIIKIRDVGYEGALRIEPNEITIPVGMVVVWVNMSRKEEPQIVFEQGMKCELSTEAAVGFKMDGSRCYIADFVMVGGTSSLKFIGEGTFDYLVRNKTGQKGAGTIVVTK